MIDRILIINGIDNDKDLSKCGNSLAKLYQEADIIYIINNNGEAFQSKFMPGEDLPIVKYFDAIEARKSCIIERCTKKR